MSARLLGTKQCFNKKEIPAAENLGSSCYLPFVISKVLAARMTKLITACARKNKHTAHMFAKTIRCPNTDLRKLERICNSKVPDTSEIQKLIHEYDKSFAVTSWQKAQMFPRISSSSLVVYILIIHVLDTLLVKISTNHESEQTPGNILYPIWLPSFGIMFFLIWKT